jgi:hypothetical protein
VPLGYAAVAKRLAVMPAEAETVRMIFTCYLELGSVQALARADIWSMNLVPVSVTVKVTQRDKGIRDRGFVLWRLSDAGRGRYSPRNPSTTARLRFRWMTKQASSP